MNTFNLPNLETRVIAGYNATDPSFNPIGLTGGISSNTLVANNLPLHTHGATGTVSSTATTTITDPGHEHLLGYGGSVGAGRSVYGDYLLGGPINFFTPPTPDANNASAVSGPAVAASTTTGITASTSVTSTATITVGNNTTTNSSFSNLQPYMVMRYYIKYSASNSSFGPTGPTGAASSVVGPTGPTGFTGATNPNASAITITDTNTNQTYYPTFVGSTGIQNLLADISTTPFSVNPNTGDLRLASRLKLDASNNTIGIGGSAGLTNQSGNAIAIGSGAGQTNQGANSIAIGNLAGQTNQAANSIVINATGTGVTGATGSASYIAPIRNPNTSYNNFLNYDASTNEVVYNYFMLPVGDTSTRPSPAVTGMMRYNTTTGYPEFYNGTSWLLFSVGTQATLTVSAGLTSYVTISYVNSSNTVVASPVQGGFTIYTFKDTSVTAPGTTQTGTVTPNFTGSVEYLVVAGGAGGGGGDGSGSGGGGGGAGGYLSNYGGTGLSVIVTSYTLTVGAGGAGGNGASVGSSGSSSVFSTITTAGGGGGANNFTAGVAGGSGGGGGLRANFAGGSGNTPSTTPSQGNNGGNALSTNVGGTGIGGGGGGSSTVGASGDAGANGGAGTSNLISGTATTYAAGGGGGGYNFNGGVGTVGVSGDGASNGNTSSSNGFPGTNGRGGGGGGATTLITTSTGGSGGSGVVIIRFPSYF